MSDAVAMVGRGVRLTSRQLDSLLTSIMLPIMILLLFVYLFGGAIRTGTSYLTYVVPGVILLCAGFGAASTAVAVAQDMTGGIIDRFRSMDVPGSTVIAGHVAASVARNVVSTALVFRGWPFSSASGRTRTRPIGSPRSASCCCSSSPSPGSRPPLGCWPARRRRPTASPSW
jgi:hypothetical protein